MTAGGRTWLPAGRRPEVAKGVAAQEATAAERLAGLVRAGLPPPRAWALLAEQAEALPPAADLAPAPGLDPAAAVMLVRGWRASAVAWELAVRSGVPPGILLERVARACADSEESGRARGEALAGPQATAVLLGVLPLLCAGLGELVGAHPLAVLALLPAGRVCAALGLLLWVLGLAWMRGLGRRAAAVGVEGAPGGLAGSTVLDLVAAALQAGHPPAGAVQAVAGALRVTGTSGAVDLDRLAACWALQLPVSGWPDLDEAVQLAGRHGVPPAALIEAAADRRRRAARAAGLVAARRLSVTVMLPTGLCLLPAFFLLAVVPVALGLAAGVLPR